jgi:hypothetical protein
VAYLLIASTKIEGNLTGFANCLPGKYAPQYRWLEAEFPEVNRSETPWLIVLMHAPWYNSYNYHYMEGESMRVMYEPWFVKYKVDVVFAGHVHAYEWTVSGLNNQFNVVYSPA